MAAEHAERNQLYDHTRNVLLFGNSKGSGNPIAVLGVHVGVALGAEYRREHLDSVADFLSANGLVNGNGGAAPPVNAGFDVYELYGEARVPLIQDMPFADDVSIDLGYRFSDYSSAGTTQAYKIGGDWAITPDIRVRGGYNRAVRAPNITELFTPQTVGLGSFNDPCAGTKPAANCARTFATAAQANAFLGNVPSCPAAASRSATCSSR